MGLDTEPAAEPGQEVAEVLRRRLAEHQPLAGGRVHETEGLRVERHAPDRERVAGRLAVHGIAQYWVTEIGEVDPDLVCPPSPELGLDKRHGSEALERAEHRDRRTPAASRCQRRAPRSRPWPADRSVHAALGGERPPHERDVPPLDGVSAELPLQVPGGGVREREHEDARGLPVEAVHDVNAAVLPRPPLDLGAGAADHRVLLGLGRGVDEKSCRLVDHEDVLVDVDHADRRQLGRGRAPGKALIVRHDVRGSEHGAGVGDDGAVHQHVSDQDLVLGAGV